MRRALPAFALLLFTLALSVTPALAMTDRTGSTVTIGTGETIDDDVVATGSAITVAGHITGDLYAFGQTVTLADTARVDGGVIAAAQWVVVAGTVGGSVHLAGQTVQLPSGAHIGGGAMTAAQNTMIDGAITRGLANASSSLQLGGTVGKEVRASTSQLTILPSARIGGDLIYSGSQQPAVPSGTIGGQVRYFPASGQAPRQSARGIGWFPRLMWLLGSAIVGLLLVRLFPRLRQMTWQEIIQRPLPTFVIGLAAVVLIPIVALVLMITVIGIPLSIVSITGYAAFLYLGWLLMAYALGSAIIAAVQRDKPSSLAPEWPFLLGMLVFFLLRLIPFLGGLVALVGLSMGMGAILVALYRAISNRRPDTQSAMPPLSPTSPVLP